MYVLRTDSQNNLESGQEDVISHFRFNIGKDHRGGAQNPIPAWNWSHYCRLSRAQKCALFKIAPRRIYGGYEENPDPLDRGAGRMTCSGSLGRTRPCILHHTLYTLHHAPFILHSTTYTLHHTPYTLYHTPYTIHLEMVYISIYVYIY